MADDGSMTRARRANALRDLLATDEEEAKMWGTRGQPGLLNYEQGGYTGELVDPNNPQNVVIDGKNYRRMGYDLSAIPGGPDMAIVNKYRGQTINHPQFGPLIPEEAAIEMTNAQARRNASEFDIGKLGVMAAMGAGAGFALGPGFAGFSEMGTAIPGMAPGTTAWGSLFNPQANPQFAADSPYWSMGAETGVASDAAPAAAGTFSTPGGMSVPGWGGDINSLRSLIDPSANFIQNIPGISSAVGAAALPGIVQGMGAAASSGGGGLLSSFLNPRTLLSAGTSLASGLLNSGAVNKAVGAQTASADSANNLLANMYAQTRADQTPWRDAGGEAVGKLRQMLSPGYKFDASAADPGYDFRLSEGQKVLERSRAAAGNLYSGSTGKALVNYGQNMASNEFGNAFNRLASLSGLGQASVNATGAAGQSTAAQQAQNVTGAGNARASGYVGTANALGGSLSNILRDYQQQPYIDALTDYLTRVR